MIIWKCFSFASSKLSTEFIADLLKIEESEVVFILEAHRDTYYKIIKKGISNVEKRYEKKQGEV